MAASIAGLLAESPVWMGESPEAHALELDAITGLLIYLIDKIFVCLS